MIISSRGNGLFEYAKELVKKASEEVGKTPFDKVFVVSFCSLSHDYQLTGAAIIKKEECKNRAEVVLYTPSSLGYRYNGEFIRRTFRTRVGDRHLIYIGTIPPDHKGCFIRLRDIEQPNDFTIKRKKYIDVIFRENELLSGAGDMDGAENACNRLDAFSSQSPRDSLNNLELMSSMAAMPCEMKCIYIPSQMDVKWIKDEDQKEDIPVCFLSGGVDWFMRFFERVYKSGDTNDSLWDQKGKSYDRFYLEPSAMYQWSDCKSDCQRHISYERAVVRFLLFITLFRSGLCKWMVKSICAVIYRRLYIRMQHARRLDLDETLEYYVIFLNHLTNEAKGISVPKTGKSFCTQIAWKVDSVLNDFLNLGEKLAPLDFRKRKEVLSLVFESLLRLEGMGIMG